MADNSTRSTTQPQNQPQNPPDRSAPEPATRSEATKSETVNPAEDLVYGGAVTNPEEVLANPAVAPQMLDDRRDLRSDIAHRSPDSNSPDSDSEANASDSPDRP
jgi:hypothetical protein